MKRESLRRYFSARRPEQGAAEWLATMVRGLDALEFLERSRELAAETVHPAPVKALPLPPHPRSPRSR